MGRTGGFLQGFTQTSLQLYQLQRAKEAHDEKIKLEKEQLKLFQARVKGQEADAELKRQEGIRKIAGQAALGQVIAGQGPLGQTTFSAAPDASATGNAPRTETGFAPDLAVQQQPFSQLGQAVAGGGLGFKDALGLLRGETEGEPFTLKPGETRFSPTGQPLASLPPESTTHHPELVGAVLAQPQLYKHLPAETRAALTPALVQAGMTAEDLDDPAEKQTRALLRQKTLFEIDKLNREKTGKLLPAEREDQALKIRSAIRHEPQFKIAEGVTSGLDNVTVGASRDDAAGDLLIVNGFAKILDPEGVVRPEEFRTVEEAQGFFERMLNIGDKIASGARLKPEVRQRFQAAAQQAAHQKFTRARQALEPIYKPRAEAAGIPFPQVFGPLSAPGTGTRVIDLP